MGYRVQKATREDAERFAAKMRERENVWFVSDVVKTFGPDQRTVVYAVEVEADCTRLVVGGGW